MKGIKIRLTILSFLQFAVWGTYLISLSQYLGAAGMGDKIAWFYSVIGFVSIFMPAIMGIIADKWVATQRLLGYCHLIAALMMGAAWLYGNTHENPEFGLFFTLYSLSVAFYMPTLALSNSLSFRTIKQSGMDPVSTFPPIRVMGTVGFIAAMWFVNCAYYHDGHFGMTVSETNPYANFRFQYTEMQLFACTVTEILLGLFCFTLPPCPAGKDEGESKTIWDRLGLSAFSLFRDRRMAVFFIFSILLGVSLQITNGFATTFITSFKGTAEYASTFGANNSTLLTSLSQISEALCILLIPFCLKRWGIKAVMLMSMAAWVLRFGLFGFGNPGDGLWMLVISMIVYGVAFDFFNVSGALFVDRETDEKVKSSSQGLFMLMTNGLGAAAGTLIAGAIVNHYCSWITLDEQAYMVGDWRTAWLIFAGYSLVVFVLFAFIFKEKKSITDRREIRKAESETTL